MIFSGPINRGNFVIMDDEVRASRLKILQDTNNDLLVRLRVAVLLELDYWENRDPPNIPREQFKILVNNIPGNYQLSWKKRDSEKGLYGKTGEASVFEIKFERRFGRNNRRYYIKGYFFEENDL